MFMISFLSKFMPINRLIIVFELIIVHLPRDSGAADKQVSFPLEKEE